jgi:phosphonate transport system permease protein
MAAPGPAQALRAAAATPAAALLWAGYRTERRARRLRTLLFFAALAVACAVAAWVAEVDLLQFAANAHRFPDYIASTLPTLRWASLAEDLAEWYWGWQLWGRLLIDTLLIAYTGTLLGTAGALALCFAASANLVQRRWVVFAARRLLEVQRSVPELVYALIFVVAFGLGPFPGMLAIALHTAGALGKLFAEVNENVDLRPVEAAQAGGATWVQAMRHAVLPQVLPNYVSYTLLRFEVNVRGAAVLGFVGAGGIGQELLSAIRQFYLSDVSAIVLMIVATVALIDIGTEWLRHRLIGLDTAGAPR